MESFIILTAAIWLLHLLIAIPLYRMAMKACHRMARASRVAVRSLFITLFFSPQLWDSGFGVGCIGPALFNLFRGDWLSQAGNIHLYPNTAWPMVAAFPIALIISLQTTK